jgi:hypothetical protein
LTLAGWLDVQNGVTEGIRLLTNTSFYMFSPRVMASEVSAHRARRPSRLPRFAADRIRMRN